MDEEHTMRYPNWICSDCGRAFGRRWNATRHLTNQHHGIGAVVSFADYLAGRNAGTYLPASPPTYQPKEKNIFDIFKDEYMKQLVTHNVNNLFNSMPGGLWQPNNSQEVQRKDFVLSLINPDDIFAYIGQVCNYCLQTVAEEIHFPITSEVNTKIMQHICDPKKSEETNHLNSMEKTSRYRHLQEELPFWLKEVVVKNWTKHQNYLVAMKAPPCAADYHDELISSNEEHWVVRAIKNGYILLNDSEFVEFLHKARNATFAIFKINVQEFVGVYLFIITNNPVSLYEKKYVLFD
jgi:hypothetical protein